MSAQSASYQLGFRSYLRACWAEAPWTYGPVWAISLAALAAVLALSHRHLAALRRQPISARRQLYLTVAWLPVVLGLTSAAAMLAPRSSLLWWLLQQQYEAVALSSFGSLLFLLLVLASAADGATPESTLGDRMLRRLAAGGPQQHFATPPLCCLLRPCWPAFHLGAAHLLLVYRLLQQFVLATPLLAFLDLWASLSLSPSDAAATRTACLLLKRVSTLLALWALFSLYQSTHQVLRQWNTTRKFVAIKAVLLLELIQDPLIALAVHDAPGAARPHPATPPSGISAFHAANATAWPQHDPPSGMWPSSGSMGVDTGVGGCLRGEPLVHFWCSFVLLLECLIMAELMRHAFPPQELDQTYLEERQGMLIELELLHQFSQESKRERSPAVDRNPFVVSTGKGRGWWEGQLPPRRSVARLPPLSTHHSAPPRLPPSLLGPPAVSRHASAAAHRRAASGFDAAVFGGRRAQGPLRLRDDGAGTLLV